MEAVQRQIAEMAQQLQLQQQQNAALTAEVQQMQGLTNLPETLLPTKMHCLKHCKEGNEVPTVWSTSRESGSRKVLTAG
eukprot:9869167-Karenia_brevis.AAC.1